MKIMIVLQRLMIIATFAIGVLFMFSETPIDEGLTSQIWLTVGGAFIVLLSIGWGWLVSKEEGFFIHETSTKTF